MQIKIRIMKFISITQTDYFFFNTIRNVSLFGIHNVFRPDSKTAKSDYKVAMSVPLSACPSDRSSICLHRATRLPPDEFSRNLIFEYFAKNGRKH